MRAPVSYISVRLTEEVIVPIWMKISKLELTNLCAVRAHDNRSSCAYYKPCADISMCKICFLNANNYLNVLKYIKHNKNKFPLKSTL